MVSDFGANRNQGSTGRLAYGTDSFGQPVIHHLRWRDETTVSVAPRHAPTKSYELGPLDYAAGLLRTQLGDFNAAFSEAEFPRRVKDGFPGLRARP
jgi:hypothetical protein